MGGLVSVPLVFPGGVHVSFNPSACRQRGVRHGRSQALQLLLLRPQQFNPSRPTPWRRPRILPHPDELPEFDDDDIDALLAALLLAD